MKIDDAGKLHVNFEKMVPAANDMLTEIVKLQLSKNPAQAKKFIDKYFIWDESMQKVADNLQTVSNKLHIELKQPLADKLLAEN